MNTNQTLVHIPANTVGLVVPDGTFFNTMRDGQALLHKVQGDDVYVAGGRYIFKAQDVTIGEEGTA